MHDRRVRASTVALRGSQRASPRLLQKIDLFASDFAGCSLDELTAMLDRGMLTIYSVTRPITADCAVDQAGFS